MARDYIKNYIGIGEFMHYKHLQIPYTGFVIGLGYAYVTYGNIKERRAYYHEPISFFICFMYIQELDMSEEAVLLSFPSAKYDNTKDTIIPSWMRELGFLLRNPSAGFSIGVIDKDAINISSIASRFAVRGKDAQSNSTLNLSRFGKEVVDEGSQRGAFRHTLWQSAIANRYGESIAKQVGYAHESNPYVNLSRRAFSTYQDADEVVDLLNNEIGRQLGVRADGYSDMQSLAKKALEVFYKDGLYTAYRSSNGTYYIDRTRISNVQFKILRKRFDELDKYGYTKEENRISAEKLRKKREEALKKWESHWGTIK